MCIVHNLHSGGGWCNVPWYMDKQTLADELLRGSALTSIDAARLVLEICDALGRKAKRRSKSSLMQLMRQIVSAGIASLQQENHTVSLKTAAWACVDAKAGYLRPVSLRDMRNYVRRLLRVEGAEKLMLRKMNADDCRYLLQCAFAHNNFGFVKARSILHGIFAFGIRHEWCDDNPVSRIEIPHIREQTIEPLSIEEVRRLRRAAANTDMELSLNLMLYGGIRPAEVARLTPEDFFWQENVVIIRPLASKTGGGRVVPLRACSSLPPHLRIIPQNWCRKWHRLRMAAGFRHWAPDACRHTFASYHAAYFRNLPELQLEMGHSQLNLLRTRYMRPAFSQAAKQFWAMANERTKN